MTNIDEEIKHKDFLKIPNIITTGRILVAFLILIFTFLNYKTHIIKWLFVGGVLSDKLDGFLARKLNQKTKLGLILEQMADTFLVLFTILFIFHYHNFPSIAFYSYLAILFTGLSGCLLIYFAKGELFSEKLIVAEFTIIFIYTTGVFYLFSWPYRSVMAYATLFFGCISLGDYLIRLYKFNRSLSEDQKIKNNEGDARENL